MDKNNRYTKMQKAFYNESKAKQMASVDHKHHNDNPDYWDYLLGPIKENPEKWRRKKALDFGCGTGRNIENLMNMAFWFNVDGVDISEHNIKEAQVLLESNSTWQWQSKLYVNNGVDLRELPSNTYDFIVSTIVLQHIAVYDIRYNLLSEMFRVMAEGGMISFQMGFGRGYGKAEYHENAYNAKGTNTKHDVIVDDPQYIIDDLTKIGFKDIEYEIRPSFSDGHPNWIFIKAIK